MRPLSFLGPGLGRIAFAFTEFCIPHENGFDSIPSRRHVKWYKRSDKRSKQRPQEMAHFSLFQKVRWCNYANVVEVGATHREDLNFCPGKV